MLEARRNDQRWRRFRSLELSLMSCDSLSEFLKTLLYDEKPGFEWDQVTLTLHDPEYEIHRMLDITSTPRKDFHELLLCEDMEHLEKVFEQGRRPILGKFRARIHMPLFPASESKRASSVAILPIIRNRCLIGSLNLGSYSLDKFQQDVSTDFMDHLTAVISICLESTKNRERLHFLGLTDSLTGVNNRRFFDQRLSEEIERVRRDDASLGCLFIDLDHFKQINDTFGHQVGDDILIKVATLIREQTRTVDVVARYGGEEFAVLLAQADLDLANEIAERIRKSIENSEYDQDDSDIRVTASVGVATTGQIESTDNISEMGDKLVNAADVAVYQAKESGRNQVITYGTVEYSTA